MSNAAWNQWIILRDNCMPFSLTLCHFRWHCGVQNTNYNTKINAICSVSVRLQPNNIIINQLPTTIFTIWFFFNNKLEISWNPMEHESMEKVPWNSMEQNILMRKFHGIPWNHRCCSNVVQKVSWNSGESSMELFDLNKFQWALKRDCEWYFNT